MPIILPVKCFLVCFAGFGGYCTLANRRSHHRSVVFLSSPDIPDDLESLGTVLYTVSISLEVPVGPPREVPGAQGTSRKKARTTRGALKHLARIPLPLLLLPILHGVPSGSPLGSHLGAWCLMLPFRLAVIAVKSDLKHKILFSMDYL
jgi:hypothetical protein